MNSPNRRTSTTFIQHPSPSPSTPTIRQHYSPSKSASLPTTSLDSLARSISSNQLVTVTRNESDRPSSPPRTSFGLPSTSRRSPNHDLESIPSRSTPIEPHQLSSPSSSTMITTTTTTTESMNMVWISTMKNRHRLLKKVNSNHPHPITDPDPSSPPTPNNDLTPKSLVPASLAADPPPPPSSRRQIHPSTPSTPVVPTPKISIAPLVPPLGFAMVAPGVYRSGHPNHCNFAFLDGLRLKSIMYICADSYRPHTFNWAQDRGLKIFHHRIDSHKHPHNTAQEPTDQSLYASAIKQVLDRRNLPILIHCNKGKHRVGTICALLRIIQGWDKSAVRIEWEKFLGEGAPPGKNMIWSPGLSINQNHHTLDHHLHLPLPSFDLEPCLNVPTLGGGGGGLSFPTSLYHELPSASSLSLSSSLTTAAANASTSKDQKIKNKIADGLARVSEWEYVNEFPVDLIQVDPLWIPSWLPIESIDG